jgi:hypothetical protein
MTNTQTTRFEYSLGCVPLGSDKQARMKLIERGALKDELGIIMNSEGWVADPDFTPRRNWATSEYKDVKVGQVVFRLWRDGYTPEATEH